MQKTGASARASKHVGAQLGWCYSAPPAGAALQPRLFTHFTYTLRTSQKMKPHCSTWRSASSHLTLQTMTRLGSGGRLADTCGKARCCCTRHLQAHSKHCRQAGHCLSMSQAGPFWRTADNKLGAAELLVVGPDIARQGCGACLRAVQTYAPQLQRPC